MSSVKPLLQLSPTRRRAIERQIVRGFSEAEARKLVSLPASVREKIEPPNRLSASEKRELSRAFRGLPVKQKKTFEEEVLAAKEKVVREKQKKEREAEKQQIKFPWKLDNEKFLDGARNKVHVEFWKMTEGLKSISQWKTNIEMFLKSNNVLDSYRLNYALVGKSKEGSSVKSYQSTSYEDKETDFNVKHVESSIASLQQSSINFVEWIYFIIETKRVTKK